MKLHLSRNFTLPIEAITETFAILAKRGVGKTYTAKKMVEQMLRAAVAPVVIADPVGVWWGLRSSADGKRPGLPIVVLGGDHGDAPLDAGAGELVARMLVEDRLSAVLDLSKFRKGEQTRFMTDFAERLYHDNREALHLMLDEADAFAPQRPMKGQERLLGAIEDLVRRGRARGIGVTLITQRAAVINKDVLTQAEVLIALRTIAPQDRAAIDAWIRVHGTPEQGDELMGSLPSLPIGTAWFWSPGWLDVFQRVAVDQIETFDSSATPKAGRKATAPRELAAVDLAKVKERLAAQLEKAKAEDPRVLRAEITRWQVRASTAEAEVAELQAKLTKAQQTPQPSPLARGLEDTVTVLLPLTEELATLTERCNAVLRSVKPQLAPSAPQPSRPAQPQSSSPANGNLPLDRMGRAMLTALAQHPAGLTKAQIRLHTGYADSGPVSAKFAHLLGLGWVLPDAGFLKITRTGLEALGKYDPLPTGRALLDWLLNGDKLSTMEKRLLRVIAESPRPMEKGVIRQAAGVADSGPVSAAFARLLRYGYVAQAGRYLTLSEVLQ